MSTRRWWERGGSDGPQAPPPSGYEAQPPTHRDSDAPQRPRVHVSSASSAPAPATGRGPAPGGPVPDGPTPGGPVPQQVQLAHYNGLSIAAFVLAILGMGIVSLVMAVLALQQIRRTGEQGHGLAVAAIVISIAVSLLWLGFFGFIVAAFSSTTVG